MIYRYDLIELSLFSLVYLGFCVLTCFFCSGVETVLGGGGVSEVQESVLSVQTPDWTALQGLQGETRSVGGGEEEADCGEGESRGAKGG